MRAWMSAAVVVMAVLVAGSGCKKECPPAPACPTCPDPAPTIDAAAPAPYDGYNFKLVEKDGKVEWSKPDTDGYVGEFGRLGRADEVDTSRKAQGYATADGRYVLAVPTRDFMNGEEVQSFAMFLFDPDGKDALSFRQWGYVGSVRVGGDNRAACSDGQMMPCTASTGDLTFEPASDGGLPALRVTPSGNTSAGPGKVRALGPADAVTYRFDANAERYTP